MNPLKWIKGRYLRRIANHATARLKSQELIETVDAANFADSLRDPDAYYRRAFQDFHRTIPAELRAHRAYYGIDRRGFGEDAFHTMWWRLVREFKPESFLEIGVYRGQVVSLIGLLAKLEGIHCEITGISPFSSSGDSVSRYRSDLNYLEDTLTHFKHFGLPAPDLVNAFSTDPEALQVIASRHWDMIYIDGNHDYDVVVKDWEACSNAIKPGGIIILDDSGLTTAYHPPAFSTAGHPGPSRLASEIGSKRFKEILQVGHNRVFQRLS
ncbi:MAG: class I SAM-dependent methyltransferase [Verrucomicrobiota bacterium]